MKVGFNMGVDPVDYKQAEVDANDLQFAAQMGTTHVVLQSYANAGIVPGDERWEYDDLLQLRQRVEDAGLVLEALENVPLKFYDQVMLGGPDRDRQIENMVYTVRNIARAGIPIFGYHWMPTLVGRTLLTTKIRAGAQVTAFDLEEASKRPLLMDRRYTEDEMWENLEHWIKIIIPVAEEEGIRTGIHPCDPPVAELQGIPQLFRSFEAYKRLIGIVESPSNCIEFCQGTFSEMEDAKGDGIYEMIEYFGEREKILYVHFRNVSETVPNFQEEFINTGHVDMYRAMESYKKIGFEGMFVDDHVPIVVGDSPWGHRGRAFANGYIQALMDVVDR
ncbi:MAG: mannonate dehydratase [Chloroflexi bacterium]|jgi:mannonate dehydratase|nr:mannonate dehydratase [Chloroflexota bacterium]